MPHVHTLILLLQASAQAFQINAIQTYMPNGVFRLFRKGIQCTIRHEGVMIFKLVFAQVNKSISQCNQFRARPVRVFTTRFVTPMTAPVQVVKITYPIRARLTWAKMINFKISLPADMIFMQVTVCAAVFKVGTDKFLIPVVFCSGNIGGWPRAFKASPVSLLLHSLSNGYILIEGRFLIITPFRQHFEFFGLCRG